MKHFLLITFLLLASFVLNSCDLSKKKLQASIETANKECPVDLGMLGELSSFEYNEDADEAIMTITFSKNMPISFSSLNKIKNTLKRSMLSYLARLKPTVELMKVIAKADSKITFIMQKEDTNEEIRLKISKEDVNDLAEGNIDPISPRDLMEIMVASTNAQCPMQIDKYTILSSTALEGSYFVYNYSVDENSVSIENIEQCKTAMKSILKKTLSTSDPLVKSMVSACKEANVGILHRYIGNVSGNVCVVKFSPSEL